MLNKPLAERLRPTSLNEFIGQSHLVSEGNVLYKAIQQKNIPSIIFWGPPGVGKTTLARIIGTELSLPFYQLSAISSGVAELRKVIDQAKAFGKVLLFIDEIHRFNKTQQDALLGAVENGTIVLIGATTENPSFEVNNALLSRCQVYVLQEFTLDELNQMLSKALKDEWVSSFKIQISSTEALFRYSQGDGRKLLNLIELLLTQFNTGNKVIINDELVTKTLQKNLARYDKSGENHYNIISAFIKSMRGSDPNAAVYYLARMLQAGESIEFIARRMIILASEDIGNANPNALLMATNTFNAIQIIGMPECRIILSQCAIYLATSPKSNSSYMAIESALKLANQTMDLPVPLHLRNAPTQLMKNLSYGENYAYAHHFENNFIDLEFLPDSISGTKFFEPGNNARELEQRNFLKQRWKEKYGY